MVLFFELRGVSKESDLIILGSLQKWSGEERKDGKRAYKFGGIEDLVIQ